MLYWWWEVSGQYRIIYLWNRNSETIVVELIGKHDEVYRELKSHP
jgi:mRNA-degrading endonuclease RelE of RelBE toxin-antitoxin system